MNLVTQISNVSTTSKKKKLLALSKKINHRMTLENILLRLGTSSLKRHNEVTVL